MEKIKTNVGSHIEERKFIALFMYKLDIRVDNMVSILNVSPQTVYNYRTMDYQELPTKVVDKLFDILETNNFIEARYLLINLEQDKRDYIIKKISLLINRKSVLKNDNESSKDPKTKNMDTFSEELGSRVFIEALMFEIKNAVKQKDDYDFISYIKKYNNKK